MNIKEAKEEIKRTVQAYMAKTASGSYRIPVQRQRPVLLIGPPGIGKTAIMEQIAAECELGLVAYTMTHHTRQSAIGLPVLEKREFENQEYTITAYTMSEIIASVYAQMEQTGRREGILFLDEINCVSETLMPAMLQFLQYKSFGSHRLPEGWVIVAAGNPPAYNRSVREFDTVTLDRVKRMDVEPDLEVWKRYAAARNLHPAILSFLELKPECFYVMEAGRKGFVTGRGWEDLSEMLLTLEDLGLEIEDLLFGQYLQEEETAREFAFYYRLYEKWKARLTLELILQGEGLAQAAELPALPFEERLCILWLLLGRLHTMANEAEVQQNQADSLNYFIEGMTHSKEPLAQACEEQLARRKKALAVKKEFGLLAPGEEEREKQLMTRIRSCMQEARLNPEKCTLAGTVEAEMEKARSRKADIVLAIRNCVAFTRQTFGNGQELVILLTGLLEHPLTEKWMREELADLTQEAAAFLNADRKVEALRRRMAGEDETVN